MKTARRLMAFVMAFVLCVTLPATAFAASVNVGDYGTIYGTCMQSSDNLVTTTTISNNPDDAQLRVNIKIYSGSTLVSNYTSNSAAGSTRYVYRYPIAHHNDEIPTNAKCTHYVIGDLEIYNTKSTTTLDSSYFS